MFKGLKAIVMLLMITVVFNILLTPGKVLWQWGIFHVTEEGLKLAGRMASRTDPDDPEERTASFGGVSG